MPQRTRKALSLRLRGKLLGDSGLADAGLSRQKHHAARPCAGLGQRSLQQPSFLAPPGEVPLDRRGRLTLQPPRRNLKNGYFYRLPRITGGPIFTI